DLTGSLTGTGTLKNAFAITFSCKNNDCSLSLQLISIISLIKLTMRNLSFTLFMFFWTIFAYGQSYDEFVASNNIDEKCRLAEKIALHYVSTNIDSLKLIGEQLLSFSNSKKSKKGIYTSYGIIGNAMVRSAQEKKGLELLRKAKNYFLSVENYDKVTEIYNEIGKDRKSTRLNSSHVKISYAVFCL